MGNRKHMRKIREKRIKSIEKQIEKHEDKIKSEDGRLDNKKMLFAHAMGFSP